MTSKQLDMIKIIMSNYAYEQQREIFVEECAEAIQAVQKCKRKNYRIEALQAFENFKEEVADVLIMAEQMRRFIGTKEIDRIIDAKLHRQINRIKYDNPEVIGGEEN